MGNSVQILEKIARNAEIRGLTVNSKSATQVVIDDGANDILIKYQAADIQAPMAGINPAVSPFLGIGVGNPGYLVLSENTAGNRTLAQFFATAVAVQVLAICASFANDISIQDGNEGIGTSAELVRVRGTSDLIGMGQ